MKKKLICALMTAAMAGSLVSGLTVSADSDSQVTISLYTTLPNKDSQFEQLCEEFMEENPDIKVNYIAYDSSEKQKWMTLYASGEAPTVSLMDAVDIRENIENMAAYDLEGDDSWIKDQVDDSNLAIFKDENGSVYGVPNSVQSMGIIYNKTTIEKATGEEFDPSTIKSNADLDALCQKIQDGGVSPIMFTGVDWSLGSHFLSQVFNGIQGDEEAQKAFIESVKDGSAELKTNDAWNGVMDTFDIIAKYNYNANDPLVGNTELDGQAMAKGDVAMWFMGDWGWSYLESVANADDEYGIMPCPLTASADDAVNQELAVFPAKGYCVDGSQNDEAQQAAGKKLVEYLTIERAQDMSDALSIALPFKNVDVTVASPLANATQAYVADGKVQSTYAFSALLPSDFWSENGAVMQQYLVGQMDRDTAADAIQAYWQAQN